MRPVDVAEALSRLQPDAAAQLIKALAIRSRRAGVRRAGARGARARSSRRSTRRARRRSDRGDVRRPAGGSLPRALADASATALAKPLDASHAPGARAAAAIPARGRRRHHDDGGRHGPERLDGGADARSTSRASAARRKPSTRSTCSTAQQRMVHVVSLRQLMLADRNAEGARGRRPQRVPLVGEADHRSRGGRAPASPSTTCSRCPSSTKAGTCSASSPSTT